MALYPRRVTSTATTIGVQAAGTWGTDSATGTLVGNIWTPARDLSGRVNLASWNIVPIGRWIQVAGSEVNTLLSQIQLSMPGYAPLGNEVLMAATCNNWNGLIPDYTNQRFWFMNAGGHNGGSDNGIYRFDCYKMAWTVEHLPSSQSSWSANYIARIPGDTYTNCQESRVQWQAVIANATWTPSASDMNSATAWYWDELFWDRKPTSRHTYSAQAYLPDKNELISSVRQRIWRYSLTTGQYTLKRMFNNTQNPETTYDGAGVYSIYDEVNGEYLHGGAADGRYGTLTYNTNSDAFSSWANPWSIYGVADTRYGRDVTAFAHIYSDGGTAYNGRYWKYNLDSRTVTASGSVNFEAPLSQASFCSAPGSSYYDGTSIVYLPTENKYWLWALNSSNSMESFEVDANTTPWTMRRKTFTGAVPNPLRNLMRKMLWMPGLNAVVLVDQAHIPTYVYRF